MVIIAYRYLNIEKLNTKSKRKKNQFVNELLKRNYPDLLISKEEFRLKHKAQAVEMFNKYGWDSTAKMYIEDCLGSYYWYKDPICYKTCLNNLDFTDFNVEFINIFGKEILKNKVFLRKIHSIKNRYLNSGY